jgi:hypothetical protein
MHAGVDGRTLRMVLRKHADRDQQRRGLRSVRMVVAVSPRGQENRQAGSRSEARVGTLKQESTRQAEEEQDQEDQKSKGTSGKKKKRTKKSSDDDEVVARTVGVVTCVGRLKRHYAHLMHNRVPDNAVPFRVCEHRPVTSSYISTTPDI